MPTEDLARYQVVTNFGAMNRIVKALDVSEETLHMEEDKNRL